MSQPQRSLAPPDVRVIGGVDTHKDTHTAALTATGRLLGTAQFPATPTGYRELLAWLQAFGPLGPVGLEGSGSYGAGLCRSLRAADVTCSGCSGPNARSVAATGSLIRPRPSPLHGRSSLVTRRRLRRLLPSRRSGRRLPPLRGTGGPRRPVTAGTPVGLTRHRSIEPVGLADLLALEIGGAAIAH